ncbi:MAG: UDP-N-acetylmuramate--L-alanine ligase [Thermoleophilia bacterium]|nr:UDP-N-acetylmuramate--L-alanine ligase [Thermoleophilia bacterium]
MPARRTSTRSATASGGRTTSSSASPRSSARPSPQPTSSWRGQAGRYGSSRPPRSRRCSSRIRTRRRTTRRRTRATSRSGAPPSSSPRASSTCEARRASSSPTPTASRPWRRPCARSRGPTPPTSSRRRCSPSPASARPCSGRRLWFVGIGGAGLSAYAVLAHAFGAEAGGWDRKETPYLRPVREAGIPVVLGEDPAPAPAGWEAVVSTAYAGRVPGRTRAELLSELVAANPSIVVSGAHGKTTTAAMIAFCLERLGRDPSWAVGGEVPQLGTHARAGSGWFVVEGDESDRTVAALPAQIAVVTNVDLDHHSTFASRAEVEALFSGWLASLPGAAVVRGWELEPYDGPLAVPGDHNRVNAACALAALAHAGVPGREAAPALAEFEGVARRLELRGEASGIRVVDDYAHHPAELRATLAAARRLAGGGRIVALFQPHLFSRTRHLAREFADALAEADAACVTEVYAARETPIPGVSGKLVVEQLAERRPGMPVAWTPTVAEGAAVAAALARPADVVLTVGAGDVDSAVPLILERLA